MSLLLSPFFPLALALPSCALPPFPYLPCVGTPRLRDVSIPFRGNGLPQKTAPNCEPDDADCKSTCGKWSEANSWCSTITTPRLPSVNFVAQSGSTLGQRQQAVQHRLSSWSTMACVCQFSIAPEGETNNNNLNPEKKGQATVPHPPCKGGGVQGSKSLIWRADALCYKKMFKVVNEGVSKAARACAPTSEI